MTAGKGDGSEERLGSKIQFHGRVQFKNIRHVSEFSEDEIKNGWYDKDDFNRMSDDVSEIAKMVRDGLNHRNGEILCTRGLEHIVEEELANFRAEKMLNSIDAVLDEQEEQWDEGIDEPEVIAELYTEYAKLLAEEAHEIGLRDAEEGYKSFDLEDLIHNNNNNNNTRSGGGTTTEIEKEEEKSISSSSSRSLRHGGSSSSAASSSLNGLNDPSTHSITEEGDSIENEKELLTKTKTDKNNNKNIGISKNITKSKSSPKPKPKQKLQLTNTLKLKKEEDNNKNEKKEKHQRKTQPRRTILDRKNGSELSPFVYRRDGTLMFRKSNVEKLKREQSEKRKKNILGSLSKFLDDDDEEEDYLADLLSK
jgi:hypothetical protein